MKPMRWLAPVIWLQGSAGFFLGGAGRSLTAHTLRMFGLQVTRVTHGCIPLVVWSTAPKPPAMALVLDEATKVDALVAPDETAPCLETRELPELAVGQT